MVLAFFWTSWSLDRSFPRRKLTILWIVVLFLIYFLVRFLIYAFYTLSGRTGSALARHIQGRAFAPRLLLQVFRFVARIYTVQYLELMGYCPLYGGGVIASQLDLLSLMPLSVAGCGQLQLGAHYRATSVALLQVVDNWSHILAIEVFTFYQFTCTFGHVCACWHFIWF